MSFESILGYLQVQFNRQHQHRQDYHGLYSCLVDVLYGMLYYRQTRNEEYIISGLRFFEGIVGLANANHPLWIFSLNHDSLIECLAAHYGLTINSGFTETSFLLWQDATRRNTNKLAVEVLSGERLEKAGMQFAGQGACAINLLKIHGALDIFTFRDGNDLLKISPTQKSVRGIIDSLNIANEKLIYLDAGGRFKATNEIVYADENGVAQFLRRTLLAGAYKFDNRFTQVLPKLIIQQFRNNLHHLSTLICIGYSFGDAHINDILRQWLEANSSHRLEIVSPGLLNVPLPMQHLTPQVVLHNAYASDYLERFAVKPLSCAERLLKTTRNASRHIKRKQRGFA